MRELVAALACVALLAGCDFADDTPASAVPSVAQPAPQPLSYDYLTKLPLDVSDIVVDDTWTPLAESGDHVEDTADPTPVRALAQMVHDRITATGGSGRALVTITDASLTRATGQLVGSFSVQVALDGTGAPAPPVVATVSGTRTLSSDDSEAATANALVRQLMDKMNVELEYQMRHQLADHMSGSSTAVPAAVQSQDLAAPTP